MKSKTLHVMILSSLLFLMILSTESYAQEATGSGVKYTANFNEINCNLSEGMQKNAIYKYATIMPDKATKDNEELIVKVIYWPFEEGNDNKYKGFPSEEERAIYTNCYHTIAHGYVRSYNFSTSAIGPVTVPIVYRRGDTNELTGEFSSELKLGVYVKKTIYGKAAINHIRYQEPKIYRKFEISFAGLISGGTTEFETSSVGSNSESTKTERKIAVIMPGIGLVAGYRSIDVGLFAGWDLGIGPGQSKWEYNSWNRKYGVVPGWYGVAIGIDSLKTNLFK